MDNQITACNIINNLKDAGFNNKQIDEFMKIYENKDLHRQILFLKCQRCALLESLHDAQKRIDCLDYLIYMLKKEGLKNEK